MLGIGLDELKHRESRRRQRRMWALVSASFAGMVIASVLAAAAWIARNEAERQRIVAVREAETARRVTRFIVDLFKIFDPREGVGVNVPAKVIIDKGAARIKTELSDQPGMQATLMDTMGTVYTRLGLYKTAIPLLRQSLAKQGSLAGDTTVAIAQSLGHLAEALMLNADYDEATRRLQDALAIQRKVLGNRHADVANTLCALADVMSFTGEYDKGQPLIEEALASAASCTANCTLTSPTASATSASTSASAAISSRRRPTCARRSPCSASCTRPAPGPGRGDQQPRLGHAEPRPVRRGREVLPRGPRRSSAGSTAKHIRNWPQGSTTSPSSSRRAATTAAPKRPIANRSR